MLFHNVCSQHSLLYEELKPFEQLYSHPKVPFLKHLKDMHEHTECIQYKYHKFSQRVT